MNEKGHEIFSRISGVTKFSVVFLGCNEALLPPNKELKVQRAPVFSRARVTCVPTVQMFFKNTILSFLGL